MFAVLGILLLVLVAAGAWLHAEKGWFQPTAHEWIVRHTEALLAYAAMMVMAAIPMALLGALAAFREFSPLVSPPELELAIAGTESPAITITNVGGRRAIDVAYTVAAMDLDREPERGENVFLPASAERNVLRGGTESQRWTADLWSQAAQRLVASRHRVVGSITLTCANCLGARSYAFSIVTGKEGWYWPQPEGIDWARILDAPDASARSALVRSAKPADARKIAGR